MAKTTLVQNETTPTQLNITQLAADGYATAGTQDGDPILADDINDYKGFSANALQKAGITASQSPDTQASSQTHDALEISVNKNAPDGTAANPSISFKQDQNTGLFRKGSDSIGVSTGGVERAVFTANGKLGIGLENPYAKLHVDNTEFTAGARVASHWVGTTAAPYQNNDCLLLEVFNDVQSDSRNQSWALSSANAYNNIPAGVTDSGFRIGVLGWSVSVKTPNHTHAGTLDAQTGVWGRAGYQGTGNAATGVITAATGVYGEVVTESEGHIESAIAVSAKAVKDLGTMKYAYGVFSNVSGATDKNYSFYGANGTFFNVDTCFYGTEYQDLGAPLSARKAGGSSIEFGFPGPGGYGSSLGATLSAGYPHVAMCAVADAAGDTFTTAGKKGTVILNDLLGGLVFGQLPNATGSQAVVEKMRIRSDGKVEIQNEIIIKANTAPASASAAGVAGEVRFDDNYIYRCVADNTWKRSPLSTW